jgi:O-succinylhomoserine sulfhydrylase
MAAVHGHVSLLPEDGRPIVAARALFGAIRYVIEEVLTRFGIKNTIVDGETRAMARGDAARNQDGLFRDTPPIRRSRSST